MAVTSHRTVQKKVLQYLEHGCLSRAASGRSLCDVQRGPRATDDCWQWNAGEELSFSNRVLEILYFFLFF